MQIYATKSEIRWLVGSNLADKRAIKRHPVIPGEHPYLTPVLSQTGSIVNSTIFEMLLLFDYYVPHLFLTCVIKENS